MPSSFLLGNLFNSIGLLCPEVPPVWLCCLPVRTPECWRCWEDAGAGGMLLLYPNLQPQWGLWAGPSVPQEVTGLAEASVRVVSHGCHPSQWREPGPSCRQSLAASCGESRGLCAELSHRAAAAAEGRAALSLPPSCGAQQPLGRIPAAGSDNLTQQAELGALSSSKHSFLR